MQSPIVTVPCALLISFVAGLAITATFKTRNDAPSASKFASLASAEDADATQSRYVQEGGERTSFRPDFSRRETPRVSSNNQRSNFFVLQAFQKAVGTNWMSTVRIFSGERQLALGAIVHANGLIITKASELPSDATIECALYDGTSYVAEIVTQTVESDLALLRIAATELPVIQWASDAIPSRGSWLATTDIKITPSAVGVVSAGMHRVAKENAVLGVLVQDAQDGAAIKFVLPGSGAQEADLQIGDSIVSVNGNLVASSKNFTESLVGGYGGQVVGLGIIRGSRQMQFSARLMDLSIELLDATEMEVNGKISARSSGFGGVFAHDTVLNPNQCGGPLVDLNGEVVGINIARAGRVTSYALPAVVAKPVVNSLIRQANLVSLPPDATESGAPIQ